MKSDNRIFCFSASNTLNALVASVIFCWVPAAAAQEQGTDPGVSSAAIAQAVELRDQAMQGTRAYEWVESLTTEIGPRPGGSAAEASARQWAVKKLSAMGFSNVRIETFPMIGWQRGEEEAAILEPYPQPLAITALGGSVATPPEGIEAELVVFKDFAALEAAGPDQVKGRLVYVGHQMQRTQDGSSYGFWGKVRWDGASEVARKGGLGIMIRSIGTDEHRMPHTGSMEYAMDAPKIPAVALSNPDADQIERIAARGVTVRARLRSTARVVENLESGNVIAEIPGRTHPEQIVIIGGHLDSWDLGTGALDDGAGVAITMEAARMILASGWMPERTIRLILWGSEEGGVFEQADDGGLVGGRAYVYAHRDELENHVMGAESDFGARRIWQVNYNVSDAARPAMQLMETLLAPLGIAPGDNQSSSIGPDLIPLKAAGLPAFSLAQDGRDYFDYHHTADDVLSRIQPGQLDQNVAAYIVFAMIAANSSIDDWGWGAASDGN
ncbi:peptidase M28 [Luminiphilus syltensis NOR5-1B]|uniref:Carboxypeptidase Q n=1 Tax=Luminiphilus syltensis NOR5-1B TaxID=565045 RepID=B8KQT4_9GAMM|nr:M28 family peptidase [Luminiphilus syltensis]EED36494.1 peptidase M28 [Luminiphilus syltensis NOR5-1B]